MQYTAQRFAAGARTTYIAYTHEVMRAFKQAPWRSQTQAFAAFSIVLVVVLALGGLYLSVAARAGTAGRDLQAYEAEKTELTQNINDLRADLAYLRSVGRLNARAQEMGFIPAQVDQVDYVGVVNFPATAQTDPLLRGSAAKP
jgi:hypothetical protein